VSAPAQAVVVRPRWETIAAQAPQLEATMGAYIDQMAVSLRPRSIDALDMALRDLAAFLISQRVRRVRLVARPHIETYKRDLLDRSARTKTGTLSKRSIHHRLSDLPKVDDPLPRFLDDAQATAFMHATTRQEPLVRLVVELLARTGLRVGELCGLRADAVVLIGASHWLRVPVGKLHNDRYVPLHPLLVELLDAWRAEHGDDTWLITKAGQPLSRDQVARMVKRVGRDAGVGHVHPHRLRHTLATQAINNGMSLEAIAAMLGHRSLRMTLVYARIADRKVAEEYYAVTAQVEALYASAPAELPASAEGEAMRRLRLEMNRRLLGNGYCTRPSELDCAYESVCETCVHFATGPEFVPVLLRQRDHAAERDQRSLVSVFDHLLARAEEDEQHPPGYAGEDPINPGLPA